jgi:hypothetical protein
MKINVEKEISPTERHVYWFDVFDNLQVVLSAFYIESKLPGKRKFTVTEKWDGIMHRNSTIDEPELTLGIRGIVRDEVINKISILSRTEWKNKRK